MQFEKWEGLGNDFVLLQAEMLRQQPTGAESFARLARTLCDRRRGIGADGLLIVDDIDSLTPRMIIHNADGSRPEMCGNGLRCVVGFLAGRARRSDGSMTVRTDAGPRRCTLEQVDAAGVQVRVAMGTAVVGEPLVLQHGQLRLEFLPVDVGNPHAVTFGACPLELVDEIGARLDGATAGGCNVEFCASREDGRGLDVTVFERGVGRTLACGTGASAAAVAAVAQGHCQAHESLVVDLPGGRLAVQVTPTAAVRQFEVELTGPARRVFRGELCGGD